MFPTFLSIPLPTPILVPHHASWFILYVTMPTGRKEEEEEEVGTTNAAVEPARRFRPLVLTSLTGSGGPPAANPWRPSILKRAPLPVPASREQKECAVS